MSKVSFIEQTLRTRIEQGTYAGQPLPGERALAREFGVSYMTARAAVSSLLESGVLVREGRLTRPASATSHGGPKFIFAVPSWNNPNYWEWYPLVSKAAQKLGGQVRFAVYQDWSDPAAYDILREPTDGLFLFAYPGVPKLILDQLEKRAGRVATFLDDFTDRGLICLNYYPANGTEILLSHLKDLGHDRVDCYNSQPHTSDEIERYKAWESACAKLGLDGRLIDAAVEPGHDAREGAYRDSLIRMRRGDGFAPAVYCTSARTAIGLCRAAYEVGSVIGSDLSVCTLGRYETCRYLTPSLTCLNTPGLEHHVERAVEYVLNGGRGWRGSLRFEPSSAELYFGESTGPVSAQASLTTPTE